MNINLVRTYNDASTNFGCRMKRKRRKTHNSIYWNKDGT